MSVGRSGQQDGARRFPIVVRISTGGNTCVGRSSREDKGFGRSGQQCGSRRRPVVVDVFFSCNPEAVLVRRISKGGINGVERNGQQGGLRCREISSALVQGGGDEGVGRFGQQGGSRRRPFVVDGLVSCDPKAAFVRNFPSRDVRGGRRQCSN